LLIGYRIINDDLEIASNAFVTLVEALYQNELNLGATPATPENRVTEVAEKQENGRSTNVYTYGALGLACAGVVGGVIMKAMKE
jgi:hypothetical protein